MTQSRHVFHRHTQSDLPVAVRGDGIYLFDSNGKRYLDASGGAAVSCLGHGHPRVTAAIKRQLDQLAYAHTSFFTTEIAETLGMPLSTVGAVLTRHGLGKLPRLRPEEPANSYERPRPGELVHIDVKKLGRIGRPGHRANNDRTTRSRGIGWEYVHVAVDDATRLAYVEVLADEKGPTAAGFLRRAVRFFRRWGIRVERVLTDNGSCYRAIVHALACKALGIRHLRTRPYRPRTNGKAERFIRTLVEGWAYGAVYRTSIERTAALPGWLDWYNRLRPHRSLGRKPPLTRLAEMNNVLGTNS